MSEHFDNPPPTSARGKAPSARELALRAELIQVRHELRQLLDELDRARAPRASPFASAVVTSVIAKTQLMYQGSERDGDARPYVEAGRMRAAEAPAYAQVPVQSTRARR